MHTLKHLVSFLDKHLDLDSFKADASNNGLQIEGKPEIFKAMFAVDASMTLFEKAAAENADFIFVHHGISWGGGYRRIVGQDAERMRLLFSNDISLYAAHLPLDANLEFGHNALLASMIDVGVPRAFAEYAGNEIGVAGELENPMTSEHLADMLSQKLDADYQIFGDSQRKIRHIGIISGSPGQDGIKSAMEENLDALITGEIGHTCWHWIKESGVTVIALGHYCTETPGVKAIKEIVERNFEFECEFVDIPTGL